MNDEHGPWCEAELSTLLPDPSAALEEALEWYCCPLCRVLGNLAFSFFRDLPVRWPRDPALRQAVTTAGGFCNHHSWRMEQMQSKVAIGTVWVDVLAAVAEQAPEQSAGCPVCRLQDQAADLLGTALISRLQDDRERDRFRRHFGLCYPHWRTVLQRDLPTPVRALLLEAQAETARQMAQHVRDFLDKNTTELRWTRTREEQRATHHALLKTAGNEDL
jgi:hypothetical protein